MNKLIAVLLLIAMLLLPALPVAATSPIPHRYFIDAEGACVAPDGDGLPTVIEGANISYVYEKGGTLAMRCRGPLPKIGSHTRSFHQAGLQHDGSVLCRKDEGYDCGYCQLCSRCLSLGGVRSAGLHRDRLPVWPTSSGSVTALVLRRRVLADV